MTLTVEEIRKHYLQMLNGIGVDEKLVKWLDVNGFFNAPATTKYHHSFAGGLALHSIETANILISLAHTFSVAINDNVLRRLGLLHDISKATYYELTSVNKKVYSPDGTKWDELGNFDWKSEVGYKVKDNKDRDVVGNFGFSSMLIALQHDTVLTNDEIVALSNYEFVSQPSDSVEIKGLMTDHTLTLLLHMADMSSSYLIKNQ